MHEIERKLAQAERLLSDKVVSIIAARRKGADVTDARACVREMHRALALLYAQHRNAEAQNRKTITAAYLPKGRVVASGPVTRGKSLHRA